MVGFSRNWENLTAIELNNNNNKSDTLSWCQISGKIQKNFTVIELIYIHTAFQEAFQEDLKYSDFFQDHLPQQIGDTKKRVYFL